MNGAFEASTSRTAGRAGAAGAVVGPPAAGRAPAPAPDRPVPPPAYAGDFPPGQADPWARGTGGNVLPAVPGGGRDEDRPSAW